MLDLREEIKDEIDWMSDEEVRGLQKLLATYPDPDTARLRRAPADEESLSDDMPKSVKEH